MDVVKDSPVGSIGRVTGTVGAAGPGEVMVPVRGGSEAFHAYCDDPAVTIEPGARIVVVEYHPPRTVIVSRA